ncbi:hypothetical protein M0805_000234 [Coniferiporia weirii]|nr:hypothetical protein M0805_000234 [Coniferiporia weirii]
MNAPSRFPFASARVKRPQRPLPALPATRDGEKRIVCPPYLVRDDPNKPFQLLEGPPLSLLCRFHNVKHVSLEEGVPPPFKLDVPIIRGALENSNALLPTHMLAVYDQDVAPDSTLSLSPLPYTAAIPSGPPSFPATPLMIPVNADLWALYFSSTLSSDHAPVSTSPPPVPAIASLRRNPSISSIASSSSRTSSSPSPSGSRPRAILSLPVHVMRVPSAKSFPLLLLAVLKVLPENCVIPALLPRTVLAELPATPAILTQHLLLWLYPPKKGRQKAVDADRPSEIGNGWEDTDESFLRSSESLDVKSPGSRMSSSPFLSPSPSADAIDSRRLSSISASSFTSASSSFSSFSQRSPVLSPGAAAEPICALADPTTKHDPDMRLLALVQQNFGMWANALALGVKDASIMKLVELALTVSVDARRQRFGDPLQGDGAHAGGPKQNRRSRSRTPLLSPRASLMPTTRKEDEHGSRDA